MKISQGFGILIYFNFILSDLFFNKYTVGAHMLSYWVTNRKPVGSNIGHTHKTCGLQHLFICCRCFFFSCSLFTNLIIYRYILWWFSFTSSVLQTWIIFWRTWACTTTGCLALTPYRFTTISTDFSAKGTKFMVTQSTWIRSRSKIIQIQYSKKHFSVMASL